MPNFDQYYPFDKGFGAPASAALWGKMAQQFVPDGIVYGYLNQIGASIAGGNITLQTGAVLIHGYYGEIQNPQTFAVGSGGMVVAAVNMSTEVMSTYYKDGVTDYSGLTQTATLWEIPLWLVTSATTVVDKRASTSNGRGLAMGVSASLGAYLTIPAGVSTQFNVGYINFTHQTVGLFTYVAQFEVSQPNLPSDVVFSGTYQYGQADVQQTYSYEWTWPGASGTTGLYHTTQSISWIWGVTPGRKQLGFHVSQAGGATTKIANMAVHVLQVGTLQNS